MAWVQIFFVLVLPFNSNAAMDLSQPFTSSAEALAGLRRLSNELKKDKDHRALFAEIYSLTTASTQKKLERGDFENPVWVKSLLVNYANIYRQTIWSELQGQRTGLPRGWALAFHYARRSNDWNPERDLLYGISVHISRDLIEALYLTPAPLQKSSYRRDYFRITTALSEAMPQVWRAFQRYQGWSPFPSQIQQSVMFDWIAFLREKALANAIRTAGLSTAAKAVYLDRLDGYWVQQLLEYDLLLPLMR